MYGVPGNGDVWRAVKKGKLTDSQWKKLLANGGVLSNDKKVWYPSEDYARGDTTKKAGVLFNGKTAEDYKNIEQPRIIKT